MLHSKIRYYILTILLLLVSVTSMALDIPAGIIYFDNSLTKYKHPKFVYGDTKRTYILSLTQDNGNIWQVSIATAASNMYRYTFADTSLPDGQRDSSFTDVKNYISNTLSEYRTATTDATIISGGTFVPISSDNWASGSWVAGKSSGEGYSKTLPVLFINTDDGKDITSKTTLVPGTYYLDNMGDSTYESLGTKDSPLPLEIRGRGNYTWTGFNKKPYKLKLGEKTKLMGMHKSRHFALLACADDELAFLRNTVGYELSRRLGLPWTPSQEPVEVVLNGSYIGLYMLTENIRIADKRVDITEQPDMTSDTDSITGGWLLEIDNYKSDTDPQVTLPDRSTSEWITIHSPEVLSTAQRSYIEQQVSAINTAIMTSDKTSKDWEDIIDIDTLARFYICQEILDDAESFHGSCFFYKDNGEGEKWMFGPVWDFGNTYRRGNSQKFIYQSPPFGQRWISDLAKFPDFQTKVKAVWQWFKGNKYDGLDTFIDNFCTRIATAAVYDARKWPSYGHSDVSGCESTFRNYLTQRVSWLVKQWGEGVAGIESVTCDEPADKSAVAIYSLSGQRLKSMPHGQIVIVNGRKIYAK